MRALSRDIAALALAVGTAIMLNPAQSIAGAHAQRAAVYLDSARCSLLAQQFEQAAAGRIVRERARRTASQGEALCRDRDFADGADLLEIAVRLIGETPATPPALHRLY